MKGLVRPLAILVAISVVIPAPAVAAPSNYRVTASGAARWLRSLAIRTPAGIKWPVDARDPQTANLSLFSGTAGVVIFLLEAARVTGDRSYLNDARGGADELLAALDRNSGKESGYSSGIAGMGFALNEVHKATRLEKYRRGALATVQLLQQRALTVGAGAECNDYTDIALGNAGIGLFLLYAAREMNQPAARDLARRAGQRLIDLGLREGYGLKWVMRRSTADQMPNFAHGTAGVAYFLATLYRETRRREFLDAALAGARYLQSIAVTEGGGCLIPHRVGENIFHLSIAHGPAGTARLFHRLHEVTGDPQWMVLVRQCAQAILRSGAPGKHSAGFWNNHGIAYGTAGLAEFFLALHKHTGEREYLEYARRAAGHLMASASPDELSGGLKWKNAVSTTIRDRSVTHPGLMHGAAGIGLVLLSFDAFEAKLPGGIVFPDSPW